MTLKQMVMAKVGYAGDKVIVAFDAPGLNLNSLKVEFHGVGFPTSVPNFAEYVARSWCSRYQA